MGGQDLRRQQDEEFERLDAREQESVLPEMLPELLPDQAEQATSADNQTQSPLQRLSIRDSQTIPVVSRRSDFGAHSFERLFRSAPMIDAPIGFADRVLAALQAADLKPAARAGVRRRRWRLPWLMLVVALPFLFAMGALTVGPGPTVLGLLLQRAVSWLNAAAQEFIGLFQAVSSITAGPLYLIALVLSVGIITMAWGWLMAYAGTRRQQVIYRVPVRFH